MKIYTLHRTNTPSGEYDVSLPLPYPYHVGEDGKVQRQEFWDGDPAGVLGFQRKAEVQRIDLTWRDAIVDPEQIAGMFPVLVDSHGGIYNERHPIARVDLREEEA